MKTPMPDVDAFVEALRGDLPSAQDEARVRARLLTATALATSAALTSANAGASLGSAGASTAGASTAGGAAAASGAPVGIALVGGASTGGAVAGGAVTGGAVAGGAVTGGAVGTLGAAAPAAAKAGLLAKLLVLPLSAKVGAVASVAVAVAATSMPLVLDQTRAEPASSASRTVQARPSAPRAAEQATGDAVREAFGANPDLVAPSRRESAPGLAAPATSSATPEPALTGAPGASTTRQPAARGQRERGGETRRRVIAPRRPSAATGAASVDGASSAGTGTHATPAAPTAPVRMSTLEEETRLMERAMLALGQGDAELARRILAEHARRFPEGLLAPERERARARADIVAERPRDDRTF